jgi:DNA polymerase-3 subunit alpha
LRGEVADALVSEKYDQAKTNAYRLQDIFGKWNFFLEVQDQGMEIETRINRDLVKLPREPGIPLVATKYCHYLTRPHAHAQEVLMCIQTGKTMSDSQG